MVNHAKYAVQKKLPNLRLIKVWEYGGINHRFNLSDETLIKDNHIAINKNIKNLYKDQ